MEGRRIFPVTLALCFTALMVVAPDSKPVAVMGSVLAGALFVFRSPLLALFGAVAVRGQERLENRDLPAPCGT